jgi:hypothetical protein
MLVSFCTFLLLLPNSHFHCWCSIWSQHVWSYDVNRGLCFLNIAALILLHRDISYIWNEGDEDTIFFLRKGVGCCCSLHAIKDFVKFYCRFLAGVQLFYNYWFHRTTLDFSTEYRIPRILWAARYFSLHQQYTGVQVLITRKSGAVCCLLVAVLKLEPEGHRLHQKCNGNMCVLIECQFSLCFSCCCCVSFIFCSIATLFYLACRRHLILYFLLHIFFPQSSLLWKICKSLFSL